ncbi:MAG: PAS domain S-box protein, partial [Candidatus Bathyarchaeia archaeon]
MKKGATKAKTPRKASKVRSATTRSITERVALQESEAKIHSILDTVVDGVITIDGSGIVRSFNPAAERLFGYKFEEIFGQNVKILMPEPYHSEHDGYLSNYLRTGKAKIIGIGREVVARRKDGTTFPIDLAVGEIKTADSKHMFTGIVRDITERKQAEEMLRESENRYRSLFDDVGDGIFIRDLQGHFLEVNRVICETLGYSRDELLHMTVKEVDTPEYALLFEKHTEKIQQDGHLVFETAQVSRNGKVRQTEVSSRLIRYKNQPTVLSVARDITERKRMSEAIDLARQYAENIVSTVRDPMVVLDSDLRIVSANRSFYENFKVNPAETEGKSLYEIGNRQWDNPELRRLLTEILPAKSIITDFELIHIFPTIGQKVMLLNARKVQAELGREPFILLAIEDITERRRAEEKVRVASLYARGLIEASLDPLVAISHEGKITDVNKATELLTGVSRDELIGSGFSGYFTDAEKATRGYEEAFAKGFVKDYSLAIRDKSGKSTDVQYNATVYRDEAGKVQGVFAAARDITERKRMSEAVDVARQYAENIVSTVRDPMVVLDSDLRIVSANR